MGRNEKAFAILVLCGIVGSIFAIVLQLFFDAGIIVDEIVTATLTLREIQLGVIVLWVVIGIGVSAMEN